MNAVIEHFADTADFKQAARVRTGHASPTEEPCQAVFRSGCPITNPLSARMLSERPKFPDHVVTETTRHPDGSTKFSWKYA